MRLVIREYLSMLKESGELDALLPDLLLSMGITPLSKAQVGVRQHGVDVAGAGPDPEDENIVKLFLLTIKQGDFNRNSWDDGTPQAVRPSLNEILDVYLAQNIDKKHESLPKKIIVCFGGDMKQNVESNWKGYKAKHSKPGVLEFDSWGGDKLALLIEQYFLDEYLFPESAQKQIRKTIALADHNEGEPRYFYTFVEDTLFKRDLPTQKNAKARRKRQRALRLLNLSLNIVFHWCQEAKNLRPALLCAERTLLLTWDWMRRGNLFGCKKTMEEFTQLFFTYIKIVSAYTHRLLPFCFVRHSLFGHGADELEYPLRTFEVIGILGVLGVSLGYLAETMQPDDPMRQTLSQEADTVAQAHIALINNNPPAKTPLFDGHAIDIALGLLALKNSEFETQAAEWIEELSGRIIFAYQLGRHFPIFTDSYDDLVAMQVGQAPPKEKLMALSTLLPMLAHWYAVLNMADTYSTFREAINTTFTETDLQLWYPDENTDEHLYRTNAGRASGITLSSIQLPETLDDLKAHIVHLREERQDFKKLSCIEQGWPWSILGLIASRHFRTPVIPDYWQHAIQESPNPQ